MISTASVVGCFFPVLFILSSSRISSRLLKGMPDWVRFVSLLPCERVLDGGLGDPVLFRQSMCEHGRDPAVEEVQDSVVNVLETDSQFMYSVAEKVGFRSAQLVSEFRQPLDSDSALVLYLAGQA